MMPASEGEDGFDERDPQMPPDRPFSEPFDDSQCDVGRGGEKERRQQFDPGDRDGGEHVPKQHGDCRDQKLQDQELGARHEIFPT
jgi:hypothetical protein